MTDAMPGEDHASQVLVPGDLWSRIRQALKTGARLPVLVQEAEFGFDLDPFANGCARFLREIDANARWQGRATDSDTAASTSLTETGAWIRLPGMFRRWELSDVIDTGVDFYFEKAGTSDAGVALFAVYRRQHRNGEVTP